MIHRLKKQRANSILGLALDGGRLDGVVLKRTNGSAHPVAALNVALSLDPLNADPELVGREIRNHLEAAEVRERRCVVAIPLNWVLALQTLVPEMPEEDLADFLQIEAERGFPYGPDALMISHSVARIPSGERFATQLAVQRDHVVRLERVLRAARLVPASFSLGLPAMLDHDAGSPPQLALAVGQSGVGLQVSTGGGLITLRTLNEAVEIEGNESRVYADVVARELRITLGQLPPAVRDATRTLRVFGSGELADRLTREIQPRLEQMGLSVQRALRLNKADLGIDVPADAGTSPALALAARHLAGCPNELEFLPPKVSAWQQFTEKYASKKLSYAGGAAVAVALLGIGAFVLQQVQLTRLRSEWAGMSAKVGELEGLQKQIRQYRPWFDDSLRAMNILRRLTEAFPEDGTVTAKSIEIRESAPVVCSGTARNSEAVMAVINKLSAMSEVSDLQRGPLRGESPVQFSFNFVWAGGSQP